MVAPALRQEAQEQRFAEYLKYCVSMSRGNEDLHQELALAAWTAIRNDVPDSLIVAHIWRQRSRYHEGYLAVDKYGKSVDRGLREMRRPDARAPLRTGDGDDLLDPMVLEALSDVRNPARLALFTVAYERFLAGLSPTERRYWELRAAGYRDRSFCSRIWPQEACTRMKRRLRERFRALVES